MKKVINDIVNDYRNGFREVYYKRDMRKGISLLISIVGVTKFAIAIGGIAFGAIGSLLSWAGSHPEAARNCAAILSKNSDQIMELLSNVDEASDSAYNLLSERDKKAVRLLFFLLRVKLIGAV